MDVKGAADRCARFIINAGDHRGVAGNILARYVDAYRDLSYEEKRAVHDELRKTPGIAYMDSPEFKCWPSDKAPEEAVPSKR